MQYRFTLVVLCACACANKFAVVSQDVHFTEGHRATAWAAAITRNPLRVGNSVNLLQVLTYTNLLFETSLYSGGMKLPNEFDVYSRKYFLTHE